MKYNHHKIIALLFGAGLLGLGATASAAIVNSKHDLGTASTATTKVTTGTDETCVFCHTPHKAASNTVPLWNKNIPATVYTSYSSTTMEGTVNMTGSTSVACLSCHDGSQAMDNIVNAPGSGGYDATGGGAGGLATYVWTGNATATGVMNGAVTNLSANLGDDHPIAIPYAGGGLDTTPLVTEFSDPDFKVPAYNAVNGGRWWFDTDTDTKMDSTEIRLYTVGGVANVECASCHDPHNATNATFLRIANTSSAVCTACHSK